MWEWISHSNNIFRWLVKPHGSFTIRPQDRTYLRIIFLILDSGAFVTAGKLCELILLVTDGRQVSGSHPIYIIFEMMPQITVRILFSYLDQFAGSILIIKSYLGTGTDSHASACTFWTYFFLCLEYGSFRSRYSAHFSGLLGPEHRGYVNYQRWGADIDRIFSTESFYSGD